MDRRAIVQKFNRIGRIPNVVGVIDGTYVPIKAPRENPEVYVNRKCFHGITLQAISDTSLRFFHCFAGYPSSVSDIRIFKNSDIHQKIIDHPNNFLDDNQILLADKAYPLYKWCIPPYIDRGNLGDLERNFNTLHASMRQVIERTFALFYGRMRRMQYLDMNRADLYSYTILAACVIHNICLLKTDEDINMYITEGMAQMRQNQLNNPRVEEANLAILTAEGRERRNEIAQNLLQEFE